MNRKNFSSLNLNPALIENLATLGYKEMTPIQAQSLPKILEGKDVVAQAKTGSGKTAAFGLGLLNNLQVKRFRVQSLVLCPTRELADQVASEIRKLARSIHNIKVLTLCGGAPIGPQIGSLEHGAHIIVGTPGRLVDHLNKKRLNLDDLNTLVLDEADRMLEMGFQPALDLIFSLCPKQRQTLLFSATFPEQIMPITKTIMNDPLTVKVTSTHDDSVIKQHFYKIKDNNQRLKAVKRLLLNNNPESSAIFCNTKIETNELANELKMQGFSTQALHGDMEQRDRDLTLIKFANKSSSVLVATDVAARGLDIENMDLVINYHLSHDPEVHIHRIGRTGRAGSKGLACTIVLEREAHKIRKLEELLNQKIELEELPRATIQDNIISKPKMVTLQIDGGKKQKVRPGDILGALTAKDGITGAQVGKINLQHNRAFVAVSREVVDTALKKLSLGKLKGRAFKVRRIS
ncbi:MAG: ATP-dependent RNA helicase DbpA [Gammaproteobacteria bacterium]|nr:MAG: ATP-dependent RNA helicase DbpA [Gammaproteobacteria bacterium]